MNPPTNPRFVLSPWEFEGSPHSPLCDTVTECLWQGETISMRLKMRENLLFFAPTGQNRKLFALSRPVAETAEQAEEWRTRPEDLQRLFAAEYKRKRWGRALTFINHNNNFINRDNGNIALVTPVGTGWVRPLFSDKYVKVTSKKALEGAEALVILESESVLCRKLRSQWKSSLDAASRQEISANARRRAHIPARWIRGSLAELKENLEAAFAVFPPPASASNFAHTARVVARSAIRPTHIEWRTPDLAPELKQIGELLLQNNVCVGQTINELNSFFVPYFIIEIKAESMHERMEAMLRLRDVTRGTPIEAQIRQILERIRL